MAMVQVLTSIGMIVLSFIIGIGVYYITSKSPKETKKKQIDEIVSQLINLVIFIWIAKVITNIGIFIKDPFAVLAYPSNAQAFYLATLLTFIFITYKVWKKEIDSLALFTTFMPVFLLASFSYEFMQMIWGNGVYSWAYLAILMVLLLAYYLMDDLVPLSTLSFSLFILWSIGKVVLGIVLPFTTVFSYIIAPWYAVILFSIGIVLFIYHRKKDVS